MPKISLRAYNREISNLIDRGQTDEAVAHCQYILQTYPKHLESYRLLGKAYLEAHRYSEAIDIFQRVLAVVPDDFITHVGISIIRNDENNLDAAIWHMERAFEVQPSNQAIQDELKHLYGRRDGQEPLKIRLTRGALCRMYARGNQTRQAIAEIKSILTETPDRVDIEVLLARMYFLSNMTNEAVDLSRKILEKLPFCYDTNKLMIEILTNAKKVKEIDPYRQKIIALEPYESLLSDPTSSIDQAPEDAITVDKMYYDPATRPSQSGQRAAISEVQESEETAPDWLVSDLSGVDDMGSQGFTRILDSSVVSNEPIEQTPASATQPVTTEPIEEEPLPAWLQDAEKQVKPTEQGIPDFLKATGWATAGTITEETPPAQVIPVEEPAPEGEIVPGEIPEWLQTLAPGAAEANAQPAEKEDNFSDWLSQLDQSPDLQQTGILSEEKLQQPAEPAGKLPDWLQQAAKQADIQTTPSQVPSPSIPDQKPGFVRSEESTSAPRQPKPTGQLKFVVDENFPIAGGTSILSPDDVPDWLQDLHPSTTESTTKAADVFSSTASLTPVEPAHTEFPQEMTTTKLTPNEKEDIPDWLRDIQGNIQAEPPVSEVPSEVVSEEIFTMKLTPEDKQQVPDWLTEIQQDTTTEPEPESQEVIDERRTATLPEEEREEVEQMPEWLHLLEQEGPETASEPISDMPVESIPSMGMPVFEMPIQEVPQVVEEISIPEPDFANPNLTDFSMPVIEEAQGIPESIEKDRPTTSILPPNPEEAAEELPEWLREIDNTASEGTSPVELPEPSTEQDEFPDWLKSYPTPTAVETTFTPTEPVAEPAISEEIPGWLQDMGSTEQSDSNLPDWLKDMQANAEMDVIPGVDQGAGGLPEWLEETAPVEPVMTLEVPVAEEPVVPVLEQVIEPELSIEPEMALPVEEHIEIAQPEEIPLAVEEPIISPVSDFVETPSEPEAVEEMVQPEPEVVEPVADSTAWISAQEAEQPESVEDRVPPGLRETPVLKGTQALSWEDVSESGAYAVPADSILADEGAAAAAAAIGIPLFAQAAHGTESLTESSDQGKPVIKEETPTELPTEPVSEELVEELTVEAVAEEPVEELAVEAVAEEPVEELAVEAVAEEPVEELAVEAVAEEPVEELAVEAVAEEPVEELAVEAIAKEPVEELAVEAIAEEPVEELAVEAIAEEPVEELVVEAIAEEPVEELVVEAIAEEPVAEEAIIATVEASIDEIIAKPEPVSVPEIMYTIDYDAELGSARQALAKGDLIIAESHLGALIQAETKLDDVIIEVLGAIDQNPVDFGLWITLGDAYGRKGNLQKALDAYTKAEEYLQ